MAGLFYSTGIKQSNTHAQESGGVADTPWPMYQHDPQHTGRSPFLGPTHQPKLLWSFHLPDCSGINGGMSIALDGDLLISKGGCLHKFDPVTRELLWTYPHGGNSGSTPLVGDDGNIYWGYQQVIEKISPDGERIWGALLSPNMFFNSSATFGMDGNLYYVHNALWSSTPSGGLRWYIPYGIFGAGEDPAIALDGTIYGGGSYTPLCAYTPNGEIKWCVDYTFGGEDRTPAVAQSGEIYVATQSGAMMAVNPDGTIEWEYKPDHTHWDASIPNGFAIAPDGSIREFIIDITAHYLYAINEEGQYLWHITFPTNELTGLAPISTSPILVDRDGNTFLCTGNSRCYGIGPDGSELWEFEFPLVDSILVVGDMQPLLAADGLIYVTDNQENIHAFADPYLYSSLTTPINNISVNVETGTPDFTRTIPISSTLSPITYTASITPTEWLTLTQASSLTPSDLTLHFNSADLPSGIYQTPLIIRPSDQIGKWLEIPVTLNVGVDQIFLPSIVKDYQRPYQILFSSTWFIHPQFALIDQTGRDRAVLPGAIPPNQVTLETLSHDGSKLAMHYYDQGYKILVMDTTTGETLLEIAGQEWNWFPSWSPDDNQLVFVSTRDDALNGELYKINLDGTGLTRLTNNSSDETRPLWSPAGDKIAFQVSWNQTYIMKSDGSDMHRLEKHQYVDHPIGWSPDGRYLLTTSYPSDYVPAELWVYDIQTGSYNKLADEFESQTEHDTPAVWSPDGRWIAYVAGASDHSDIYVVKPDGSNKINLTNSLDQDIKPVWSADSKWIAFTSNKRESDTDPNWDIYVVHYDGSYLKKITTNIGTDSDPIWLPYRSNP